MIFELAYFGNGGFQIDQLYKMPIERVKFYYELLIEYKEKEAKEIEKATSGDNISKTSIFQHLKNKFKSTY